MKQLSEMEEKPFTSSLNIYPGACHRYDLGGGGGGRSDQGGGIHGGALRAEHGTISG
jgi:hypothetical protein